MIDAFLPCDPPTTTHQAKQIVTIRAGSRSFSRLADKPTLVAARAFWTALLAPHRPPAPLSSRVPVSLTIEVCYPWPASYRGDRFGSPAWKTSRPDCSNLVKTIEDVLVTLGFFTNDAQVAELVVRKTHGHSCGLRLRIKTLKDWPE